MSNDIGQISVDVDNGGGCLVYRSAIYGSWHISLDDLVLVGEYTSQDGPYMEDHFFVFLTKNKKEFEAPVDADGMLSALDCIGAKLGVVIERKLIFETNFNSRILAPLIVQGKPLYYFVKYRSGFWANLMGGRVKRVLSTEALAVCEVDK